MDNYLEQQYEAKMSKKDTLTSPAEVGEVDPNDSRGMIMNTTTLVVEDRLSENEQEKAQCFF